jgi:hypothetical protein
MFSRPSIEVQAPRPPDTAPIEGPFGPDAAGVDASWSDNHLFKYNPHPGFGGHELRVVRPRRVDPVAVHAFRAGSVRLAWDAQGFLITAVAWSFAAVEPVRWEGLLYTWWVEPDRWPALECKDARLLPPDARIIRLVLADALGEVHAERRILMPQRFAYTFNKQIVNQSGANFHAEWIARLTAQLKANSPTPGHLAAACERGPGGPGYDNPKNAQICTCEDVD